MTLFTFWYDLLKYHQTFHQTLPFKAINICSPNATAIHILVWKKRQLKTRRTLVFLLSSFIGWIKYVFGNSNSYHKWITKIWSLKKSILWYCKNENKDLQNASFQVASFLNKNRMKGKIIQFWKNWQNKWKCKFEVRIDYYSLQLL